MIWPWRRRDMPVVEQREIPINDRVFLLGLDRMIRDVVLAAQTQELCWCAERVAAGIGMQASAMPTASTAPSAHAVARYLSCMDFLQAASETEVPRVAHMPEFQRLLGVSSSRLFGRARHNGRLLPERRDALTDALDSTPVLDWSISKLLAEAKRTAESWADISVVGLACRISDPLSITVARDNTARDSEFRGASPLTPKFSWEVSEELTRLAGETIAIVHELFGGSIPAPIPEQASNYFYHSRRNVSVGRCVCLGIELGARRHYHWAVTSSQEPCDFWAQTPWTTETYRAVHNLR